MAKVFVSGPHRDRRDVRLLTEQGFEVVSGPGVEESPRHRFTPQEWRRYLSDADAMLVASRDRLRGEDLRDAPRLRAVVKASIGVDRIDLAGATEAGVLVVNSPSRENYIGVAEAVVGLMLAHSKRMFAVEQTLRGGGWKTRTSRGDLLAGTTLGLVGFGRIGSTVAHRLSTWDMEILASDPYRDRAEAAEQGVQLLPLEELLSRADVVSLHVVLNDETRRMIGREQLALMKPRGMLINTSRGGVVDEPALVDALEDGRLSRAALDVFEVEPLPMDSPLRRFPPERVILTPHTIANTHASGEAGLRMAVESVTAVLAGEVPEHVLNRDAVPAWRARFPAPA
ncbi:MAG: dehydrogenase [Propionibacteriales bacterium]|nr:dehydrogenase [Propionibacteriales bacterium]